MAALARATPPALSQAEPACLELGMVARGPPECTGASGPVSTVATSEKGSCADPCGFATPVGACNAARQLDEACAIIVSVHGVSASRRGVGEEICVGRKRGSSWTVFLQSASGSVARLRTSLAAQVVVTPLKHLWRRAFAPSRARAPSPARTHPRRAKTSTPQLRYACSSAPFDNVGCRIPLGRTSGRIASRISDLEVFEPLTIDPRLLL